MRTTHLTVLVAAVCIVFLIGPSQAMAQAPSLGTAANFGVLGGSAVTNTGSTAVTGELGVSPGTAISGFPPGVVTGGTIHSNDGVAQQAQSDLVVAYTALAALPCDTDLTGQDLGGLTLTAGVYCFSASAQLTGTLTLNAQGDPNAQFIFQVGSTLTTASNAVVLVTNGGNSCNVFWQVGSSATLGTATAFAGNITALTSITLTTGANVAGRLLARNGAVTLDSNRVAVCPACQPIALSPSSLPNGTIGTSYNQVITATGGTAPYSYSVVAGSIPTGLTLSSGGTLSGTPSASGSFTFTVRAVDTAGCFGSRVYTIVINAASCPTITLSPATLTGMVAGTMFSQQITGSGGTGPYAYAVTSGALPAGLTLTAGGLLSGTPTETGSFTFTVTATDDNGCLGSQMYTALVNCPAISIAPATLSNGTIGLAYGPVAIVASGGTDPYTYEVVAGSLPAGLTLSGAGSLSGTPTTPGSSTFTVRATDDVGCLGERVYTLVVTAAGCSPITVSPATLPAAVNGTAYSETLTASGGAQPYTFAVTSGALPPGLNLSSAGVLSGTPTSSGGYAFTVTATDSANCLGSQYYALVVSCPAITLGPPTLPNGSPGSSYHVTIAAGGGIGPYTYAVTSGFLPPGLTLSSGGLLSGTPTTRGTSRFTITATDSTGCEASRVFRLTVAEAVPTLAWPGLMVLLLLIGGAGVLLIKRF